MIYFKKYFMKSQKTTQVVATVNLRKPIISMLIAKMHGNDQAAALSKRLKKLKQNRANCSGAWPQEKRNHLGRLVILR